MSKLLLDILEKLNPQNHWLFACDCAERVLPLDRDAGRNPDNRAWTAVDVAREYAMGRASLAQLQEASQAAMAVTREIETTKMRLAASWIDARMASRVATWCADDDASDSAVFGASWASWAYGWDGEPAPSLFTRQENLWQEERAAAFLEAQQTAQASLIAILRVRSQRPAIVAWIQDTEDELF